MGRRPRQPTRPTSLRPISANPTAETPTRGRRPGAKALLSQPERSEIGGRSRDLRLVLDLDDQARIAVELGKRGEDRMPEDGALAEAPVAVGIAVGVLQVHV